ncbi:MAG: hypothetical protein JWL87_727 [Candidatus Adlerbacteria bacterium]|nr:hypothetical protein [Candidatus Adlerbacteria bacterium]
MTPEKIISTIEMYEEKLRAAGIPKTRSPEHLSFRELTVAELLAHAHYACDNVKVLARDPAKQRRTGSHLTVVQMCLSFAGWYSRGELMAHNYPDPVPAGSKPVEGSNFGEPRWAT